MNLKELNELCSKNFSQNGVRILLYDKMGNDCFNSQWENLPKELLTAKIKKIHFGVDTWGLQFEFVLKADLDWYSEKYWERFTSHEILDKYGLGTEYLITKESQEC